MERITLEAVIIQIFTVTTVDSNIVEFDKTFDVLQMMIVSDDVFCVCYIREFHWL